LPYFLIALYILSANGINIPWGCWAVTWGWFALRCISAVLKMAEPEERKEHEHELEN